MHGPELVSRSLSFLKIADKFGNHWQYHSQSDRHSKIACWGILFDLLLVSAVLRKHFADGTVVYGVNHEMRDFRMDRKKKLDLVVCTPAGQPLRGTLADAMPTYGIVLDPAERSLLAALPVARRAGVGMVRLALEAKACMTAHVKAIPRLHDELNSSHLTIHGAVSNAIAAGFVMVNVAETFVSPGQNRFSLAAAPAIVNHDKQPHSAQRVIDKVRQIARRTRTTEEGFDALGIVAIRCQNDGSPVTLSNRPPAPGTGDIFEYDAMIRRVAELYEARYR